ncbi:MAG: heme biosynthesis protein HemY [Omnitrophica bacterium RIFCSPHIGHO2_02_FULL_49_9]|nr:MAG: heme biosynthesis protein HemY [Omnitrophica bacterium RIFCSPHIGHO2_02_FULL_49_9]OGW88141.1 MAG: heme biosynthesis protein HemY [Omnitrophica bacterium RIFCSPLOWO2_01_FULL_50_24]
MVKLTPSALTEVKRLHAKGGKPDQGLRVGVHGGGCSGLSYKLGFDEEQKGDRVEIVEGIKILVDPKSELYLSDTTVDFVDGLQDRGFKFLNPNAKTSCGCGESFSV